MSAAVGRILPGRLTDPPVPYLHAGEPVLVLLGWRGRGPRNVLIRRADGTCAVRPFRGLRRPTEADMTGLCPEGDRLVSLAVRTGGRATGGRLGQHLTGCPPCRVHDTALRARHGLPPLL